MTITNVRHAREFEDQPLMTLITYKCGHTIATGFATGGRKAFNACPRCRLNVARGAAQPKEASEASK